MAQQLRAMIALPEDQGSFPSTSQLSVIPFLGDSIPLYRHICRQKNQCTWKKSFEETNYVYIYIKEYIHTYTYILKTTEGWGRGHWIRDQPGLHNEALLKTQIHTHLRMVMMSCVPLDTILGRLMQNFGHYVNTVCHRTLISFWVIF